MLKCNFVWIHAILESCLNSRSFRLLSSHLDQDELLASARMTSPVIGLAIGILATSLLQVSFFFYLCLCLCLAIGTLATSLFQSSSATTSLVVAMVASGTITVEQVIISSFFPDLGSNDGHTQTRGSQL